MAADEPPGRIIAGRTPASRAVPAGRAADDARLVTRLRELLELVDRRMARLGEAREILRLRGCAYR